jgi:hypothetical protein
MSLNFKENTADIRAEMANKANKGDYDILESRVDNLSTLEEGSTTGDAELIDARVGADGATYTNTGGAIRGQILKLGELSPNMFRTKNSGQVTLSSNGIDVVIEQEKVTINGTCTAATGNLKFYFGGSLENVPFQIGETVTLSLYNLSGSFSGNVYVSLNSATPTMRLDLLQTITFQWTGSMICLMFYINSGVVFNNFSMDITLSSGNQLDGFVKYGLIATDHIAKNKIEKLRQDIEERLVATDNRIETHLTTVDKYNAFEKGTFTTDGLPSSATYRLRSINFIPIKCLYKVTWSGAYIVSFRCYDREYQYIGCTADITDGEYFSEEIPYTQIAFVKILFSTNPVAALELSALQDANFKVHTIIAENNKYNLIDMYNLPNTWTVDKRNINKFQGTKFSFALQTDTHFYNGIETIYYNALKNLSNFVGLDFIANLGDVIRGYEYDTVSDSSIAYSNAIKGITYDLECDSYVLIGNHDNGSMYATQTGNISDAFLPEEMYSTMYRPCFSKNHRNIVINKKHLCAYIDYNEIRLILLNTSDLPYQVVNTSDINVNNLKVTTEQAEWFSNIALNTDKPVIILSHATFDSTNGVIVENANLITTALSTFKQRGGTVIACISGHKHILANSLLDGINHILCKNGSDVCEIFAVDLETRTIITQQIGKDFTSSRNLTY